jgi:large subunit ribosomal protein L25
VAEELVLRAEPRDRVGKGLAWLRQRGWLPAVVYGHEVEAASITVEQAAFARLWRNAGTGHMVQLEVKGEKKPRRVLIREVQIAPRTGRLQHVDLYQVNPKERVHTEVPVVLEGEPPLVTLHEAQLVRGLDRLRIECLPDDLPESFVVDIGALR